MAEPPVHPLTLDRLLDEGFDAVRHGYDGPWLDLASGGGAGQSAAMHDAAGVTWDVGLLGAGKAGAPAAPSGGDETVARAGEAIGPYRLVREVARGGMGSVWVAERRDGTPRRQVALKLPRLAWGAGLAERMARERDISAWLEHPNIARLYDAGVDARGRPYLAFELIEGVRIDAWCTQRELSVRARLQLFLQVAQAVAYAHARLVVHRDLKPSNVLVSADGQVHLLDFGIAKRLREGQPDDTALTELLGQALTPGYASPEQVRGEAVTVASDVYSLGVLLHELLTGRRPQEPGAPAAGEGAARARAGTPSAHTGGAEGEVPASRRAAGAVAQALRGDVDAILAKALRAEPAQRYATVDAMAEDVRRHLDGEPVGARPATAWYRLRKFTHRHRVGCGAGATAGIAAIVAAGVMVVQSGRATEEAEQAARVERFVIDAFRASVQDDDGGEPGDPAPFERLLERNAQLIDRAGTPRLQAQLHGIVADMLLDAGSDAAAAREARSEQVLLDRLEAPASDRAAAALLLSKALLGNDRLPEAESEARKAVALAAEAGDPLAASRARVQLGAVFLAAGRLDSASSEVDHAQDELPRAGADDRLDRARAMALRAAIVEARGDEPRSEALLRNAIETAESAGGPPSRTAIDLQIELARHLVLRGRGDEARALLVPALVASRTTAGASGVDAALIQAEMGALALYVGADGRGLARTLDEVESGHAVIQGQGERVSALQRSWADIYAAQAALERGHYDLAQALAARAAPVLLPNVRDGRARLLLLEVLGRAAVASGQQAQAGRVLADWLDLATRRFPAEAWRPRLAMVQWHVDQGRWDDASKLLALLASAPLPSGPRPRARIADEGLRLLLDSGQTARAAALALDPAQGADALPRAEALCASGRSREGQALVDEDGGLDTGWRYAASPEAGHRLVVRALCALAAGRRPEAAALAGTARSLFDGQPGIDGAWRRPLERLERGLQRRRGPA